MTKWAIGACKSSMHYCREMFALNLPAYLFSFFVSDTALLHNVLFLRSQMEKLKSHQFKHERCSEKNTSRYQKNKLALACIYCFVKSPY